MLVNEKRVMDSLYAEDSMLKFPPMMSVSINYYGIKFRLKKNRRLKGKKCNKNLKK